MTRPLQRVRIAILVNNLELGGAERVVLNWLAGVDLAEVEPTLILLANVGELRNEVPEGVEVHCLYPSKEAQPSRFPWVALRGLAKLGAVLRKQDLLVGTGPATHVLAWIWGTVLRKAWVAWVHYVWGASELTGRMGSLTRLAYAKSRYFVFVSNAARDAFRYSGLLTPHSVLTVVHNPLGRTAAPSITASKLAAAIAKRKGPAALFVGRLAAVKNVEALIQAIGIIRESAPSSFLAVVGDGAELNHLVAAAASLFENERNEGRGDGNPPVLFLGVDPSPSPAMRLASVLAMSSTSESWGMAAVEAMSQGTPVVAFDAPGGLREIVNPDGCPARGALAPMGDVPELARRMLPYLADPSLKTKASAECRRYAGEFDMPNLWPLWREVVAKAVAKPRGGVHA